MRWARHSAYIGNLKKYIIFQSEHLKGRGGVVNPGAEEGEILLKII
jgi:hypothetical protein